MGINLPRPTSLLPSLPGAAGGDFATIQLLTFLRRKAGAALEPDLFLSGSFAGALATSVVAQLVLPRQSAFLVKKIYVLKNQGATATNVIGSLHRGFDTLVCTKESLAINTTAKELEKLQGVLLTNPTSLGGVEGLRIEMEGVAAQVQEMFAVVIGTPLVYVPGGTESLDSIAAAPQTSFALRVA